MKKNNIYFVLFFLFLLASIPLSGYAKEINSPIIKTKDMHGTIQQSKMKEKIDLRPLFIEQKWLQKIFFIPHWLYIQGNGGPPIMPDYPLPDEIEIEPVQLEDSKIRVIVPGGYEALGEKHLQDLKYCFPLVGRFLPIKSFWDGIILKIYAKRPDSNRGGYYQSGRIMYARTRDMLDLDLENVLTNDPDGFLYQSSPSYCANTHEFTHYMLAHTPLPLWAEEGIAEYSQKFNQPGSKDRIECRDNGWYGRDYWGDDEYKLFPYSDLSREAGERPGDGPKWYSSAMCFWELFDSAFGEVTRHEIFKKLSDIRNRNMFERIREKNAIFIQKILYEIVRDHVTLTEHLQKFGFSNYGDDFNLESTRSFSCNDHCWFTLDTKGICGADEGARRGSIYCPDESQCVCIPRPCATDNPCPGANFICIDNKCVYPDCNYACRHFHGYRYGRCGVGSGHVIGTVYCEDGFEQCRCHH